MKAEASFRLNGRTLRVFQDPDPVNPWDPKHGCDHVGTMALFHRRYCLPNDSGMNPEELAQYLTRNASKLMAIEVRGYDHSGFTIGEAGDPSRPCLNDMWDSGKLGYLYCTFERARKESGLRGKKMKEWLRRILLAELNEYDQYLQGDVWGYIVTENGEETDSCWGFFGDTWQEALKGCVIDFEEFLKHPVEDSEDD